MTLKMVEECFTLGLAVATLCALMRVQAKRFGAIECLTEESIPVSSFMAKDTLAAIHGKENIDKTSMGRMVSIKKPTVIPSGAELPMVLSEKDVNWKQDYEAFTSSPCIVGDLNLPNGKNGGTS